MACAESLTVSFAPNCSALKKTGGFANFGYIGTISDLSGITVASGAISALAWDADKVLTKFTTKERSVTAESPIEDEGEGNVTLVNHTVNLPIYFDTQAELTAIDTILQSDRLFVILPTSNKQFRAYGLVNDLTNYDFENFGLKVSGGSDAPGQNLNDPSRMNLVLSGQMPNVPPFFLSTDYTATLALLEDYLPTP